MDWNKVYQLIGIVEKLSTHFPGKYTNIVNAALDTLQNTHNELAPPEPKPAPAPAPAAARSDGVPSPTPQGVSMAERRV